MFHELTFQRLDRGDLPLSREPFVCCESHTQWRNELARPTIVALRIRKFAASGPTNPTSRIPTLLTGRPRKDKAYYWPPRMAYIARVSGDPQNGFNRVTALLLNPLLSCSTSKELRQNSIQDSVGQGTHGRACRRRLHRRSRIFCSDRDSPTDEMRMARLSKTGQFFSHCPQPVQRAGSTIGRLTRMRWPREFTTSASSR